MKKISQALVVPVLLALILSIFPIQNVVAQTTDYELTSVTGVWTATNGGGDTVTGVGTNHVSWGRTYGTPKSGLQFLGSSNIGFDEGAYFVLGNLTHLNWPVHPPTANGATLQITLHFAYPDVSPDPSFTFDFEIEETSNAASNCPIWQTPGAPPCDDRVSFPDSYGQEIFTVGDKQYTLKIIGFVDSTTGGAPVEKFITHESENNTAYLVGVLSSVLVEEPAISITKKTNDQDVSSSPGPELVVGDSVTWQYIVQNTGNVDLTNVSVVDDQVGTIACPKTSLDAGELMTCTASGTVASGHYQNTATVTAHHPGGTISDSDSELVSRGEDLN